MKNLTKLLALVLACVLLATCFIACGDTTDNGGTTTNPPTTNKPDTSDSSSTGSSTDGRYDASFDRNSVADGVPTDLSFTGETVTFFTRNDNELWQFEMDVDTVMNDTLYDAIYYRNKTVEERLGITIDTIQQAGNYTNRLTWNDTLRTAVNTKTGDFDAAAIYTSQGSVLAVEGLYYNVIDFPHIDLEKPWWNQNIQSELTMFDTLYYLSGDIAATEMTETFCLIYNKNLYDKYYGSTGTSIYDIVNNKEWTIGYMYDLVAGAYEDTNGDGVVSDGDVVGLTSTAPDYSQSWFEAWIPALGISYTTMNHGIPELSFYSERTVGAFEQLGRLIASNPGTLAKNELVETKFVDGKALFGMTNLNAGSGLRDMKDAYGVLPLPMLNEEQGEYRTSFGNVASLVTILSSLPNDRKELVGATLELMAAESYKQVTPAYFEIAVKTKYAESPEDAQIYDLILNATTFSFGACYGTESIKGAGNQNPITVLFRRVDRDLVQLWEENVEAYEQSLEKLINGLDEAAFNAMMG